MQKQIAMKGLSISFTDETEFIKRKLYHEYFRK
jgi:hypothetical protein